MVVKGQPVSRRGLWFPWPRTRDCSVAVWPPPLPGPPRRSPPVRRPGTPGRAQRKAASATRTRRPGSRAWEDSVDWAVTEHRREEPAASDSGLAGRFSPETRMRRPDFLGL